MQTSGARLTLLFTGPDTGGNRFFPNAGRSDSELGRAAPFAAGLDPEQMTSWRYFPVLRAGAGGLLEQGGEGGFADFAGGGAGELVYENYAAGAGSGF